MPTKFPQSYPQIAQEATLRLHSEVKDYIHQNGSMSFHTYMELVLYHPEYGYYTRGHENVGKKGDFFTSVSIGACFGIIIAQRITKEWINQGKPMLFHIIELGANTGQLANDILNALRKNSPEVYNSTQYHIIEHLESIQSIQKSTLSDHTNQIHHHKSLANNSPIGENGTIISNELIDAFPVQLLEFNNNQWHERTITLSNENELDFTHSPLSSELKHEILPITESLPTPPENYQTEYRRGLSDLALALKTALTKSLIITIDYGHTRSSYYTPSRKTGTLRCYHQHQADENPLLLPGLKDITAHVDFTQLGNAFRNANLYLTQFSSQSHYLTTHGTDWLTSMEKSGSIDFKLIRQFQTLTHPTTMGHQFHILEAHTHCQENPDTLEKLEITH